jgi:transcriptional regulator with XRE-family HTH domain
MRAQELGYAIRRRRIERDLTQAQLAAAAGLSRTTLNQLETGLFTDLGVRKLQAILDQLGLTLSIREAPRASRPDFIRMACTTASVSYKSALTEDELVRSLISGKVPPGKRPHLRALLDEATTSLLKGLVRETSRWTKPGRVKKNIARIAREVGASRRIDEWLTTT